MADANGLPIAVSHRGAVDLPKALEMASLFLQSPRLAPTQRTVVEGHEWDIVVVNVEGDATLFAVVSKDEDVEPVGEDLLKLRDEMTTAFEEAASSE